MLEEEKIVFLFRYLNQVNEGAVTCSVCSTGVVLGRNSICSLVCFFFSELLGSFPSSTLLWAWLLIALKNCLHFKVTKFVLFPYYNVYYRNI